LKRICARPPKKPVCAPCFFRPAAKCFVPARICRACERARCCRVCGLAIGAIHCSPRGVPQTASGGGARQSHRRRCDPAAALRSGCRRKRHAVPPSVYQSGGRPGIGFELPSAARGWVETGKRTAAARKLLRFAQGDAGRLRDRDSGAWPRIAFAASVLTMLPLATARVIAAYRSRRATIGARALTGSAMDLPSKSTQSLRNALLEDRRARPFIHGDFNPISCRFQDTGASQRDSVTPRPRSMRPGPERTCHD
jgi:hypothetical protein